MRRCACIAKHRARNCNANGAPVSAATFAQKEQPTSQPADALLCEEQLVSEIIARSFPNLIGVDIRLKRFQSDTDYFRTSFSAARFIAGVKMRYFVLVNPEWRSRGAPVEGVGVSATRDDGSFSRVPMSRTAR